MMERAGIASVRELLERAGRIEEPHAAERFERTMYGMDADLRPLGLSGLPEALGIAGDEMEMSRLVTAYMPKLFKPEALEQAVAGHSERS